VSQNLNIVIFSSLGSFDLKCDRLLVTQFSLPNMPPFIASLIPV